LHLCRIRKIASACSYWPECAERVCPPREFLLVYIGDVDPGTPLQEGAGDPLADIAGGTGDQDAFASGIVHFALLPDR
jgi:hypothetical protein